MHQPERSEEASEEADVALREDVDASRRAAGEGSDQDGRAQPLTGKAATQERILAAATDLFLSRGYETTTVAQVAERASVSRATVFWHFSDKESLFRECFNRICEPFRVSLTRDFSSLPPEKRLQELVELYQSFVAEHRADVEGFVRWAMEHTNFRGWLVRTLFDLHQRFAGVLTEAIAEIVPPHRDPHAIAMTVIIMLDGGILLSYFDQVGKWEETRQTSVRTILEMIPRRAPNRL